MKRELSLLLAGSMTLGLLAGCQAEPAPTETPTATPTVETPAADAKMTAGTYEASATGYNGAVTLAVTVSENAIEDITVKENIETAAIGGYALEVLAERVVKYQSLKVDSVSGATVSSAAMKSAVQSALKEAGATKDMFTADCTGIYEGVEAKDTSADVVIVGGGAAGMIAAARLAEEGYNIILVEKREMLGGTSSRAGAQNYCWNSQAQKDSENPMSFETFMEKSYGSELMNYDAVKIMAEKSGEIVDWLRFDLGVDLSVVMPGGQAVTVPRRAGQRIGSDITVALKNELDRLHVDYRLSTPATKILVEDGKAVGVTVEAPNGTYNIMANAVVITSGGYSSNPEAIATYIPSWAGAPSNEVPEATGDGIWMAQEVGASIKGLSDEYITLYTASAMITPTQSEPVGVRAYGGILVNLEGKRFFDELHIPLVDLAYAAQEQPEGRYFGIVDQAWVDTYGVPKTAKAFDTIEELAEYFGIDPQGLADEVAHYNEMYEAGVDTDFGRMTLTHNIATAPYYGLELVSALHGTEGGIEVDLRMQALKEDGTVFEGLYAGGGVAEDGLAFNPGMSSNLNDGTIIAESIMEDFPKN